MLRPSLAALDRFLMMPAPLFGSRAHSAGMRHAILLGLYAAIYAACALPIRGLPLAVLGLGYLGVVALGRAWSANERMRSAIAKKLAAGNPDDLPDLRGTALLSALQLAVLFPLLFHHLQLSFGLYRVPAGTTLLTWTAFTFDSFCRLFVNFAEIYDVSFTRIEFGSVWGRHLVLLKRLTFEYLLIQGFLRVWAIRAQIREAVAAVRQDEDVAVRLGRRATPALVRLLSDADPSVRKQAVRALGKIKDGAALGPLRGLLRDTSPAVREAAAQALGDLGDREAVEPLIQVLQKEQSEMIVLFHDRRQAAESLGNLGDPRAIGPLNQVLQEGKGAALGSVREALAKIHQRQQLAEAESEG